MYISIYTSMHVCILIYVHIDVFIVHDSQADVTICQVGTPAPNAAGFLHL